MLIGFVLVIPILGAIVSIIFLAIFIIAGPSIAGDVSFLAGLLVVFIICAALYIILLIIARSWRVKLLAFFQIICLALPNVVLIWFLWGDFPTILYLIFLNFGIIMLIIALKKEKRKILFE